jgi:PIN domain nuclease of toxin-antitoxin system
MKYVIDTHALIWFLEGNNRLGIQAKVILSEQTSELILPAIALAEAVWIVERGKTSIPSVTDLLTVINADPRITIYPLDQAVINQTLNILSINEMHDRQIVAITLLLQNQEEKVALLSCDLNISESDLITVIW